MQRERYNNKNDAAFSSQPGKTLLALIAALAALIMYSGCGQRNREEAKSEGQAAAKVEKPVYGKITELKLGPIDHTMAVKGKEEFQTKCSACHKYDERYVGPALGKVTLRRPPEYIMNMILDTDTMIDKDDTVKCLLQTYLLRMPNQHVDEKDARNVLEHLREMGEERKGK